MAAVPAIRGGEARQAESGGGGQELLGAKVAVRDEPDLVAIVGEDKISIGALREREGAEDKVGCVAGEAVTERPRERSKGRLDLLDDDVEAGLDLNHITAAKIGAWPRNRGKQDRPDERSRLTDLFSFDVDLFGELGQLLIRGAFFVQSGLEELLAPFVSE